MIWDFIKQQRGRLQLSPPRVSRGRRWEKILWYTQARVSQVPIESLEDPSNAQARVTHIPIESLEYPTSVRARITHVPIEVLETAGVPKARLSQEPIEALIEIPRGYSHIVWVDG